MKTHLVSLLIILFFFPLGAQYYTVDNKPGVSANFSVLQEAIDSVPANSTLYIADSQTSYGNITIRKPVILIGAGRYNTVENPRSSKLGNVVLSPRSDGSQIHGFYMGQVDANDTIINDLVFSGNRIAELHVKGSNLLIENNTIASREAIISRQPDAVNVIIQNNYIHGRINGFSNTTVLVRNNVFAKNDVAFSQITGGYNNPPPTKNIVVENNIFLGRAPGNCDACIFRNNVSLDTENDTLPVPNSTGENNYIGVDPGFVNVPIPYISNLYNVAHDWRLKDDSPLKAGGTDGTEPGLYGGTRPFFESGAAWIPQITDIKLSNTIVPPGAEIDVSITIKENGEK